MAKEMTKEIDLDNIDDEKYDKLVRNGTISPYDLEAGEFIAIPMKAIKGRAGGNKSSPLFVGNIDLENKVIRIDNLDVTEFYLEIDLSAIIDHIVLKNKN